MIIVEPTSGLCSRIFVISEAYELAKKYNKKLVILWTKTTDCNIGYFDIFEKQQFSDIDLKVVEFVKFGISVRDVNKKRVNALFILIREVFIRLKYKILHTFYVKYYKSKSSIHKNAYLDGNSVMDEKLVKDNNCFIEAYNMITGNSDLQAIKIKEEFVKEAEGIISPYLSHCVGIHIRRTDHQPAISESRTESFVAEIRNILKDDGSMYFYLSTDDWNEEKNLKEKFGNKIITQPQKTLNRFTEDGMYSSIIDFLCLSRTNYIIGSFGSIFSKFSAQYGKIELKIL